LIGDAAHVTSPAGGIGISLAIQDAVAAANKLAEPLHAGRLSTKDLAAVQRRRGWQILLDQRMQVSCEKGFVKVLDTGGTWEPSLAARLALQIPVLRDLPVRLNAFGFRTERLKPELVEPSPSPTGSRAARKLGLRNDGR
jgi:2-polyprenyl-6-methoxyphenol hydroxylase-like FAD-dependent oxidoreductase